MGQLLLGSLITLAVTAVVQMFFIPRMLNRDRRRERWERDVIELHTLLHDELPDMITAARSSAERYRRAMQSPAPPPGLAAPIPQVRAEATQDARDMMETVRSLSLMDKRVRLVNRRAHLWADLHHDLRVLADQLARASVAYTLRGAEDAAVEQRWTSLEDSLERAVQTVELVAIPMKPPPANRLSAWLFGRPLERARSANTWTQAFRRVSARARRSPRA